MLNIVLNVRFPYLSILLSSGSYSESYQLD